MDYKVTNHQDLDKFREDLGLTPKPPEDEHVDLSSVNQEYRRFGTAPVHPNFKKKQHSVFISDQAFMALQAIAAGENLYVGRGTLMGSPSVSELMECLGLGIYRIVPVEGAPPS